MGAPNDVVTTVTVDRLLRVVATAMENAHRYELAYPNSCLDMLKVLEHELRGLLKTFGRRLGKDFGVESNNFHGFVLIKEWAYLSPSKPQYTVCFTESGWMLVCKPGNEISFDPSLLADIIGGDCGGMSLFIDACAFTVEELFRKRHAQLHELEDSCLIRKIDGAFHPSKWCDTKVFLNSLG